MTVACRKDTDWSPALPEAQAPATQEVIASHLPTMVQMLSDPLEQALLSLTQAQVCTESLASVLGR